MGILSSRLFGSGKGLTCWQNCSHNIFECEFIFCVHVWTLFTQSCIALSTLRNDVPRAYKANSSTNKEKSVPYITDLTMLFILMLKRTGDRMLPCTVRAVLMTLNLLWPLNIDEIRIPLWKVVNDLWNLNPKDPKGCRVSMLYHRLFPNKRIWLERVSF